MMGFPGIFSHPPALIITFCPQLRDMLNRFPNLHILDQVPIPRICLEVPVGSRVEPISELKLSTMQGQAYTWPCDVAPGFQESPVIREWVNEFLAK